MVLINMPKLFWVFFFLTPNQMCGHRMTEQAHKHKATRGSREECEPGERTARMASPLCISQAVTLSQELNICALGSQRRPSPTLQGYCEAPNALRSSVTLKAEKDIIYSAYPGCIWRYIDKSTECHFSSLPLPTKKQTRPFKSTQD